MKLRINSYRFGILAVIFIGGLTLLTSCKGKDIKPVNGLLEAPLTTDSTPELVGKAMENLILDNRFENILTDEANSISVWSLLKLSDEQSAEGYGVVVKNGQEITSFPNIRHGRMPKAHYDATSGNLWLTGADVEGTGTLVERLYLLRFNGEQKAEISASIDPFEMQKKFLNEISYSVDGKDIILYANGKEMAIVRSQNNDVGSLDENAVWIGEQLSYDISGDKPIVRLTPGLKFTSSDVLNYDEMPTLAATVTIAGDGFMISSIRVEAE